MKGSPDGHPPDPRLRGTVIALGERRPRIHPSVFIAPGAIVAGDVEIGEDCSVWPGCVLRADYGSIRIGPRTNIQDGSVIHCTAELATVLGAGVVVGHGVRLEGCVIEDGALVGMGAIVLHQARIGAGAVVAAGAVVSPRTVVPPGTMALGVPATVRDGGDATAAENRRLLTAHIAEQYAANAARWMAEARLLDPDAAGDQAELSSSSAQAATRPGS